MKEDSSSMTQSDSVGSLNIPETLTTSELMDRSVYLGLLSDRILIKKKLSVLLLNLYTQIKGSSLITLFAQQEVEVPRAITSSQRSIITSISTDLANAR